MLIVVSGGWDGTRSLQSYDPPDLPVNWVTAAFDTLSGRPASCPTNVHAALLKFAFMLPFVYFSGIHACNFLGRERERDKNKESDRRGFQTGSGSGLLLNPAATKSVAKLPINGFWQVSRRGDEGVRIG